MNRNPNGVEGKTWSRRCRRNVTCGWYGEPNAAVAMKHGHVELPLCGGHQAAMYLRYACAAIAISRSAFGYSVTGSGRIKLVFGSCDSGGRVISIPRLKIGSGTPA